MKLKPIFSLVIALCIGSFCASVNASDKDKKPEKPKRIELATSEQAALAQANLALQQAEHQRDIVAAQASGVVQGIAVSKFGVDWATKFKFIKTEDGKYAFEEIPPPSVPQKENEKQPPAKPGDAKDPNNKPASK